MWKNSNDKIKQYKRQTEIFSRPFAVLSRPRKRYVDAYSDRYRAARNILPAKIIFTFALLFYESSLFLAYQYQYAPCIMLFSLHNKRSRNLWS